MYQLHYSGPIMNVGEGAHRTCKHFYYIVLAWVVLYIVDPGGPRGWWMYSYISVS